MNEDPKLPTESDPPSDHVADAPPPAAPPAQTAQHTSGDDEDAMGARLSRLSGEAAPDLSPEEFARLQQRGTINIDPRGRVRVSRREEDDPGVSLRKRRAWYGDVQPLRASV